MRRWKSLVLAWCLHVLLAGWIQARPQNVNSVGANAQVRGPTVSATRTDIGDKALKIRIEIRNDSGQDIWLCEDISVMLHDYDSEVFMAQGRETLLIRRRLDVDPCGPVSAPPHGRYVRLREGQSRTESLLLSIPVESRFFWASPTFEGKAYAKRLALEIGYYAGDMPRMIRTMLEDPAGLPRTHRIVHKREGRPTYVESPPLREWFRSLLYFNWLNWPNRNVRHRDEEIRIPWTGGTRMGEQVLRIEMDGLQIPYEEGYERPTVSPPDLSRCTRLEMCYEPSVLDYFFPYSNERAVMSPEEMRYLRSLQTVIADDPNHIMAFSREISEQGLIGGFVSERSSVHVVSYHDDKPLTSFTVYDDRAIVTEQGQCIRYSTGLPTLKRLTSGIHPFQLRWECANNLMNLSSLLRFVYGSGRVYPASEWCESILSDRRASDVPADWRMRYLRCPTQDHGECHYALNPDCELDSPSAVVFLFETKAGWNQHGGPELFTFDNHDPKGGLVLLNDGTVKFIRTEEELKQLRWK